MAHKRGTFSTANGHDSKAKRLGVEHFGGQQVRVDKILARQHGASLHPGENVGRGSDDTFFTLKTGAVKFGICRNRRIVSIVENDS